jgi:hypothetical protein
MRLCQAITETAADALGTSKTLIKLSTSRGISLLDISFVYAYKPAKAKDLG